MRPRFAMTALLISFLAAAATDAAERPGLPVFGDDFDVVGLFVENWEATKGTKSESGRVLIPANNNLTLRRVPDGDFAISAELTVEKPAGPDIGHCGVILDGIHFMVKPTAHPSGGTAYRVPGEERSRGTAGAIPGFEFGKPCRFQISRARLGKGYSYTFKANGQLVDAFSVVMPANGKVSFYGYKTNLEVDNFQLYALKGDASNNLAVNSSFEHLQEGMPIYMKPRLGGKYAFDGSWTDFIGTFAIDAQEKRSGSQSVRMTCGGPASPSSSGVGTHNANVMSQTPVTFSVYLKASEDNFPVTLSIWELHHRTHTKSIRVSKTWERYAFTVEKPEKAIVRANVTFGQAGTVWADDIQIEIGAEATPYAPSPLDKEKCLPAKAGAPVIEPDIRVGRVQRAPVVDGELEPVWFEKGAKTDSFFLRGWEAPANRTEAYVACDGAFLYVAVRAFVPNVANVKGTRLEHDNLRIHGEDCIEILLDTTLGRERYHHLTVNAAGAKTDMAPGRILAWNGEWDAAAKINAAARSIDYEVRIPIAMFTGVDLAGRWGLNIGRNDTASGQAVSLLRTKEFSFHVPSLFPALVLPEGIVERYRIGLQDLRLVAGPDSRVVVSGAVGNGSGKVLEADIQVLAGATENVVGTARLALGKGATALSIPLKGVTGADTFEGVVVLSAGGEVLLRETKRLVLARPLECYTRLNYYMGEEAAELVGTLALPDAATLKGRISLSGKTFEAGLDSEFALELPLKEIGNGEHTVALEVLRGAETVASGTATLVKRAFRAGATQIDRQRRCLVVDGKPYLAIAPFFGVERGIKTNDQERVLRNMVRLHKEMGYRCFLPGAVDDPPVGAQTQAFFDLCAREGIKSLFWPFQSWNRRAAVTPEQRMQSMKSDGIIGWLVVDEPELYAKSEEVEAFMEAHRRASPYTPVFMNNTLIGIPGRFAGLKTDILMLDDYLTNREGRKVAEMIRATEMMWEAGRAERLPVFYFLAGENLHNHYRECTYAEQVAQTYGVIIAGARGVSYFCSLPLYPEDYRACVDVNRELLELEDAIFSLEKTSPATVTGSSVVRMTRRLGKRLYIIALNVDNDRPVDVDIGLPSEFRYAAEAEVKFEGRKVKVTGGKIADVFKPLERHVYVATLMD